MHVFLKRGFGLSFAFGFRVPFNRNCKIEMADIVETPEGKVLVIVVWNEHYILNGNIKLKQPGCGFLNIDLGFELLPSCS